ncbi:MAG: class I SAM-dependent methyltransferase, partial [Anaerolineae bacterium]
SAPGDISSTDILVASWRRLPFTSASFDLILAPRGVPFRGVALEAALNAIRPLLRPGGALFLGVANRRSPVHRASAPSSGISPRRLKSLLRRAEYVSVEFYGVMPDLDVPEYIFPLSPYALSFALRHRYRRRLPPRWSGWFAHPLVAAFFLPFLPAWYVLARVPDESEG